MVRRLIDWALANPLIVLLSVAALAVGGGYAFSHVNIEAYPDPAPAIIEVVAHVALNVFTNYVNNVAETTVDFPAVPFAAAA